MSADTTPRIQPTPEPGGSRGMPPGETVPVQGGERAPRLPHERDESSSSQELGESRDVIEQAARDTEAGIQDSSLGPPMDALYQRRFRGPDGQEGRGHDDGTAPSERDARHASIDQSRGTPRS